jgi:hypothetical protein
MLKFYEEKGRKVFVIVLISIIIIFSFAFIVGEFVSFHKDVVQMETDMQVVNQDNRQKVVIKEKEYNGQIEYIEGDVEKRANVDTGWFSANKSDVIRSGDEVRTLANSRAIITIEDGSVLRLDENTHILFDGKNENILVAMNKGYVYNNVSKNDKRIYTVKTGDYEIKALGTEFSVENDNEDIDVIVVESAVYVSNENANVIETVEEGNKIKVTEDKIKKEEIVKSDLEDEFIVWSTKEEKNKEIIKEVDLKDKENKKEEKQEKEIPVKKGTITLSGKKSSSGVRLHWEVNGVNTSKGFKVVKSKNKNPVYPGDDYKYLSDSEVRDYKWKIDTGKKYHFRVCAYLGDGRCGIYSNDIEVRAPEGDDKDSNDDYATNVSLKAEVDGDEVKLKWEISGGDAPKGFKVVKSKNKNPVYPGDDYKYLSDSDTRKYTWKDLKKGKEYHFRVCIYKGGKCGEYSNDVKISL